MNIEKTSITIGDSDVELEIGRYAQRASAAVTATIGETVVFVSVVMGRVNENLGYFPLQVEYQEKLFAGGRIKGSRWVKRDGRPSDEAIQKARLIDRSIRPLFPKGMLNEIQIVVKVLSADGENDADIPAMYAVSAALAASPIPWDGPISAIRIGLDSKTNKLIINPTFEKRENSLLDLILSGTDKATLMVEAGAKEVDEAIMLEAFKLAEDENKRIAKSINSFAKKVGKPKVEFTPQIVEKELKDAVNKEIKSDLANILKSIATLEPVNLDDYIEALDEKIESATKSDISNAINDLIKDYARRQTLEKGVRPDGRSFDEIRPLTSEVGLLPRTHGSAMFKRGSTQALTIVTLGSPSLNQLIENMEGEYTKRYIHHYSMPPYTVGETGRIGWPSRREIGHGSLAERALEPLIPSEEDFPYTIHVASELMSSNGSTSMASVCGSTLSLMDAGVPIIKPVAGIAMGLIIDGDKHVVLSDIMGFEDHTGDMDFKVAGTKDGITAMQMDMKVAGISLEVLKGALEKAKVGRLAILDHMLETLPTHRDQVSAHAPKIETLMIPVDRIGEIIGPGGKIIKAIITETEAEIDINDDGMCFISSLDANAINSARGIIEGILKDVEVGEEYDGKVARISDFGAFVDLVPGKSGLVHVSKMSTEYVKDPTTIVQVGDTVHVRVVEIDDLGRINLTMLSEDEENQARDSRQSRKPRHNDNNSRFQSRPKRDRR